MLSKVLFENSSYRCVFIGRDPDKPEQVIDTNQFILHTPTDAILLDPGGIEIFPRYLSAVSEHIDISTIRVLFSSHQDPDIISSLAMWVDLCPDVKIYCSWLWETFLSHFSAGQNVSFDALPDEGCKFGVPGIQLKAIPAHYCHSSGNFSVWDPESKLLFSGDVGAALVDQHYPMEVDDFDKHIQYMEAFHKRWMPANKPLRQWARRARALKPDKICPQHGSFFAGENVNRFLDWLESLDVEALDPNHEAGTAGSRSAA